MKLFTAKEMRELDRLTIENHRVPSLELMENAALALSDAAERMAKNKTAAIFCGSGNNGGDGVAAARILAERGFAVRVFTVGSRDRLSHDCSAMADRLAGIGLCLEDYAETDEIIKFTDSAGVIIDAMLGTGLNSPIKANYAKAIRLINSAAAPTVSADIPSGISADSGAVLGSAVKADETVTFGFAKIGNFIEPGCVYSGRVTVADIGILPDEDIFSGCITQLYGSADAVIPKRNPLSHKGDYGKLLILGGSVGYTGAPYLAAEAAVHSGAGLVFLGVPEDIYAIEAVKCTESMPFPLKSVNGRVNGLSGEALEKIDEKLSMATVCLAGPGMGRGAETAAVINHLIEKSAVPLILDADGINALSENIDILDRAVCPVVLTPHEVEFARMGGVIGENRLEAARTFAMKHSCYLVLKGHRSITAFPNGRCFVNTSGNPGMAKGGSGDVLSGIIAALCAQLGIESALPLAVYLQGLAGDMAAKEYGEYSMTPFNIISMLPRAFSGS